MLKVQSFVFGPFSENTFIIWDSSSKEGAVIDPGCMDPYEERIFCDFITGEEILLQYMLITHGHIDHILGCKYLKEKYDLVFYAPEQDLPLLSHADQQAAAFRINMDDCPAPDKFITEKTDFSLSSYKAEFLFTPGHTPGEHCIYFPDAKICFTGDVLFDGSIGRTDLWGGDYTLLLNSIQKKLLILPEDVIIYPGHMNSSTIGKEKRSNPFLKNPSTSQL